MGLFDLFKSNNDAPKEPTAAAEKSNLVLTMPLFNSSEPISIQEIVKDLREYWELEVSEIEGDLSATMLKVNREQIALAFIDAPIPPQEFENICEFNYLWPNGCEEIKNLKSHAIHTILSSSSSALENYILMTQINASILRTSANAMGIYFGSQTLMIPKDLYLDYADMLAEDSLPISLWIYIGFGNSDEGNSIYTYGLKEFGKLEMEIINSKSMDNEELYGFMMSIIEYVIGSDITLKNGETLGFSEDHKINITESKGVYLEGNTLKLEVE